MTLVGTVLLSGCVAETPGPIAPTGDTSVVEPAPVGDVAAVRLEGMDADRSDPAPERRNPFRFGPATQIPATRRSPLARWRPTPISRTGSRRRHQVACPRAGAPTSR